MSEWVEIAKIGDVAEGQVKIFETKGQRVALAHVGSDYFALQDLCTHDDGPLGEGELIDNLLECPRHGARFDVQTGKPVTLPAVVPVKTYPVKVAEGKILVEV